VKVARPPLVATLLALESDSGTRSLLIDCGMAEGTAIDHPMVGETLKALLEEGRLPTIDVAFITALAPATAGALAHPALGRVDLREIWLPWMENTADADAAVARRRRPRGTAADAAARNAILWDRAPLAPRWFLSESSADCAAEGLPARRTRFVTDALPGCTITVLAPPRGTSETWFGLSDEAGDAAEDDPPFARRFEISQAEMRRREYDDRGPLPLGAIVAAGREDPQTKAFTAQRHVAAHSTAVAIEAPDATILLAGDARPGLWDAVGRAPRTAHLLERADLLISRRTPVWPPTAISKNAGRLSAAIDSGASHDSSIVLHTSPRFDVSETLSHWYDEVTLTPKEMGGVD
jgi:hypothetical protein